MRPAGSLILPPLALETAGTAQPVPLSSKISFRSRLENPKQPASSLVVSPAATFRVVTQHSLPTLYLFEQGYKLIPLLPEPQFNLYSHSSSFITRHTSPMLDMKPKLVIVIILIFIMQNKNII